MGNWALSDTVDGNINWVHVTVLIANVKSTDPLLALYTTESLVYIHKHICTRKINAVLFVFVKE